MAVEIRFDLLGPLTIRSREGAHSPRGPKITKILAMLALRPALPVETTALVEELWGENPPARAVGTVRTHVYHLRRLLSEYHGVPGGELVRTEASGYVLAVEPYQVDAVRFAVLAAEGRQLCNAGRLGNALSAARKGLGLWRGAPLANVRTGRLLGGHVRRLGELHTQLLEVRIEAEMASGRHRELIPELRDLIVRDPLNEWFHACLMEALRRADRRADALKAFQELRVALDLELGVRPSTGLRELQRGILLDEDGWRTAGRMPSLSAAS
ncbi:AfsR/SARP family transcriptional regulator [Amycolatopsis sp. H20-H5]|uniref:AfsR/SARP family transcriptional regulator n=1 Tax=Amycolatopsis sp. H20-H5 TaxID=3046309 RepID=UPI002DB77AE6|nr:AfsR/SARP family transcriptional regulator [Amycolatopsis sp. H20-H5]MEC3977381.1 AfsR/SARP family transcriptional regulator [Amycolatopsis sp. H20-H5]